ncbi:MULTISPECIES: site-specific integrase [Microbacterium]|uniref:Site-specific integrase n=1 Tax=Microbacterium wangchenii TaxID=2541726 RepID=A0ABX5SY06_9MICO|nr:MULTISPECIES: site-specific integrase [Microbacterium]MCK6065781.1 site-specific integrase [Microbacterium sp. EYE_512]QBR90096.1 site-specific integrase [Microbacterium wangchenii]
MGSVHAYSTKSGKRYLVRYKKPDGTHGAKRGFVRKREAEAWLVETEASRARGAFIDPQAARIKVEELGAVWLEAKRHSMKPSSFAPVETAWRLRVQPAWGGWSVSDIRHSDVRAWVSTLSQEGGATVTIRTYGVLASILDDAVHDGRISINPARKGRIALPRKTKRRHGYLTHEQVFRLAEASGDHRLLILVLAYTGIRWGEVAALRVEDIDFARRRLHISRNAVEVHGQIHVGTPKSHSSRAVPVPQFIIDELTRAVAGRRRDALVFPGPDGSYMRRIRTSSESKSWFKTALRTAELPQMTMHDLRHTAASLAVQSGANVKTIQRMLGHTSAAMTLDVYSDLFDDDLDNVASALDHAAHRVAPTKWPPGAASD